MRTYRDLKNNILKHGDLVQNINKKDKKGNLLLWIVDTNYRDSLLGFEHEFINDEWCRIRNKKGSHYIWCEPEKELIIYQKSIFNH